MWLAALGLTLTGMGSDSVIVITGAIMSEQFEDMARQKIFSLIQGAFTLGGLLITLVYFIWEDWFIAITYFLFIPAILAELGLIFLLKESPFFMIRNNSNDALK
jgi:MFS family permease